MNHENQWMGKSKKYKAKVLDSLKTLYGNGQVAPVAPVESKVSAPPAVIKKSLIPTEFQEQCALVAWIKHQPKIAPYLIKITNEGKRTRLQGFHLKSMGMQPGVSDLFLAYPTGQFAGLWLEIKRNRAYTPSEMRSSSWEAQIQFIARMKQVGFAAEVCYGFEHGKRIIETYLSSM